MSFFKDLFNKHAETFREIGVNANNGFGDVIAKIPREAAKTSELRILMRRFEQWNRATDRIDAGNQRSRLEQLEERLIAEG